MNRWQCRIDWNGDFIDFGLPAFWGETEAQLFAQAMGETFHRAVYLQAPPQEQGWHPVTFTDLRHLETDPR